MKKIILIAALMILIGFGGAVMVFKKPKPPFYTNYTKIVEKLEADNKSYSVELLEFQNRTPNLYRCFEARDCVSVVASSCGCGGDSLLINKSYQNEWQTIHDAWRKTQGSPDLVCFGCFDMPGKISCSAGRCVTVQE